MLVNITTYNDAGFSRSFTYKDSSLVPIDLTNITLRMHVRARAADATVFIALSNEDGDESNIVVTDATAGKFSVTVPYETLLRLPVGTYEHSLIATGQYGARDEVWRGTLTHLAGPTRWGSS